MNLRNRSAVWLRWNVEIDFDALHSRSLHIRDANLYAGQAKRRRQSLEPRLVQPNVNEGADEHVTGDAAGRIENRNLHVGNS